MEFQLRYFKSSKMMLWKCCTQYASKFGKHSSGYRTEKVSFHSNERHPKECLSFHPKESSNYRTVALISHASKVMLKILQARFQQYLNWELPDVQIGFRKGRGTRDQIANICWIIKKVREFQKKHLLLMCWLWQGLWLCGSKQAVENSRDGNSRKPDLPPVRNLYAGQEATVRTGMEQQIVSKSGKEYVKAVYCHSAYLTYMQSTSWETLGWMKYKLESRLPGEISITSDMQMKPHFWHKAKKN